MIEESYLRLSREVSATVLRQDERIDALREGLREALDGWSRCGETMMYFGDRIAALHQLLEGK